jgi:hypothetical protein
MVNAFRIGPRWPTNPACAAVKREEEGESLFPFLKGMICQDQILDPNIGYGHPPALSSQPIFKRG